MDRSTFIKKIFSKKTQDYTYAIGFFLIFSFFVLVIIRPNLLSVFVANAKIDQLTRDNRVLDGQIENIIKTQESIEKFRDSLYLLHEAIPTSAQVNKILSDLNLTFEKNNLNVDKIDIGEVNLKDIRKTQKINSVLAQAQISGNYEDFSRLVAELYNQGRLKLVKKASIIKNEKVASGEAPLKIKLDIEGYYL